MTMEKSPGDRSQSLLIGLVSVGMFVAGLRPGFAAQTKDHGDKPGHPWHGKPGITETVDEIMARESLTQEKKPKRVHESHRTEVAEQEPPLQDNPLAPQDSQWPSAN